MPLNRVDVLEIGQSKESGYEPDDHWVDVQENRTQNQWFEECCRRRPLAYAAARYD